MGKASREGGYDFTSYLISSNALLTGSNPYLTNSPFPYIYPLFLASVLVPFTYLPYTINIIIWFILNVSACLLTLHFLQKQYLSNSTVTINFLFILFLTVILIFDPLQNNLLNGQVNFIVLLFCVLFFYYEEKSVLLSSFFLAIAISIKIVPIIFLLYLIVGRKYLNVLAVLIFSFFFIFVLPFIFIGIKVIDYYNHYFNSFIFNSFSGVDYKTKSISFTLYDFVINIFGLTGVPGIYLRIFLISLIIAPIIYVHKIFIKSGLIPQRKLIIFSLLSLSILLISPSSQTHHLIFLIPATFLIVINLHGKSENTSIFTFYYLSFFILFWLGSIFKYSIFIFLSIITLYIIIIISQNKMWMPNEKI